MLFIDRLRAALSKRLLKSGKPIAKSSIDYYIRTLGTLNNNTVPKSLLFLKDTTTIDKKLLKYKDNTQKSMLNAIVVALETHKKDNASHKHYFDKMMGLSKSIDSLDTSIKTATESKSWISWPDVLAVREKLKEVANTDGEFQSILEYLVLSLYTMIQPRRVQDYLMMFITASHSNPLLPTDKNYIDYGGSKKPMQFIFNVYKTAKTHGQQIMDIPNDLKLVIMQYVKAYPVKKSQCYRLLVNKTGKALTSGNAITRILNKIFKKKVSVNMLRHSYLSNKYNIDEMKSDAEAMGHSLALQKSYLRSE